MMVLSNYPSIITTARLAQSVARETLTAKQGRSQGCGFEPHVGLTGSSKLSFALFGGREVVFEAEMYVRGFEKLEATPTPIPTQTRG
jgi:hypothetical protein